MTPEIYEQYQAIKTQYPGHIVLMRVGDFLEAFDLDAGEVARVLNVLPVTVKGVTMAGFPFGAAEENISKLIEAGWTVALAEPAKGPAPAGTKTVMTQGVLA